MESENSKLSFLEKVLGKARYSHNTKEAEFYCCFCFHHKKKLSINIGSDNWKCWVCGKAGKNLLYVLKKAGSRSDIKEYLQKYKAARVYVKKSEEEVFCLSLPKDFTPLVNCRDSVLGQRAIRYLHSRGISDQEILRNKMGISFEKRYYDRVILPSFDKDGFLNFFTARAVSDASINYLDPEDLPKGYKERVIMNELNIDWEKPIVLTEGYFDMLKAENAIPLFGSLLSQEYSVFQKIVHNKCEVILALDADAKSKAIKMATMFMSYDIPVSILDLGSFKDLGEMTRDDFRTRYESVQPATDASLYRERLRLACL